MAQYIVSYRISWYWRHISSCPHHDNSCSNESIFRTILKHLLAMIAVCTVGGINKETATGEE